MVATTRNSAALTVTTPSDREIVISRIFDAPRALVFDAYTNPEHLPHWLLGPPGWTMPICEIDLRPGGTWHFGWRHSDGTQMEMRGTYKEVTPPERIVFTESWGGDWPEILNTQIFSEENGKTTVVCTLFYPSKEARDAALKTGMKEGMALSFKRLDERLGTLAAG